LLLVDVDGHSPAEGTADDVDLVEAHRVEDRDDVGGHPLVVIRVGRLGLVGAAMASQVDTDRTVRAGRGETTGDRVEESGAEPVGMEEHDRAGTGDAAPVEDGDRQAVVLDGEPAGRVAQVAFFALLGATRGGSLGIFG
jgi:hypothetical protein